MTNAREFKTCNNKMNVSRLAFGDLCLFDDRCELESGFSVIQALLSSLSSP